MTFLTSGVHSINLGKVPTDRLKKEFSLGFKCAEAFKFKIEKYYCGLEQTLYSLGN
jgi:hypothetical protein